jgi:hypothetical protein
LSLAIDITLKVDWDDPFQINSALLSPKTILRNLPYTALGVPEPFLLAVVTLYCTLDLLLIKILLMLGYITSVPSPGVVSVGIELIKLPLASLQHEVEVEVTSKVKSKGSILVKAIVLSV